MTLEELFEVVSLYVKRHKDDTVVVETVHGGIPTRVMVKLTKPAPGFDWTKGRFIFRTEDPIVPCKIANRPTRQLAREVLEKLKACHAKLHSRDNRHAEYIPKSHENSWIDGFQAGIRCYITSVELGEEGTKEKVLDVITSNPKTDK